MQLNEQNIRTIARLARLQVNDKDISSIANDLSHILDWVEQLNAVDCKNEDPMFSVILDKAPARADQVTDGNIASDILKNAPKAQLNMFEVPKVVE